MKMIELCGGPVDGQVVTVRPGVWVYIIPTQIYDSNRVCTGHPTPENFRRAVYQERPKSPQRFDFQGYDE